MVTISIGDRVTLLPPFSSEKTYTVTAVQGAYLTLSINNAHKDLIIHIKCAKKKG